MGNCGKYKLCMWPPLFTFSSRDAGGYGIQGIGIGVMHPAFEVSPLYFCSLYYLSVLLPYLSNIILTFHASRTTEHTPSPPPMPSPPSTTTSSPQQPRTLPPSSSTSLWACSVPRPRTRHGSTYPSLLSSVLPTAQCLCRRRKACVTSQKSTGGVRADRTCSRSRNWIQVTRLGAAG